MQQENVGTSMYGNCEDGGFLKCYKCMAAVAHDTLNR